MSSGVGVVLGSGKACERYVVNCAGERTAVGQEMYTERCAIGNTDGFLTAFKDYVYVNLLSLGKPAPLNIVIPSHKSGSEIFGTLLSLLSQDYKQSVEILVFVNEPPDVDYEGKAANGKTVRFLESLVKGKEETAIGEYPQHEDLVKQVFEHFRRKKEQVKLVFVRETIIGGTAEVYQIAIASYVARLRQSCDEIGGSDRAQRLKCIREHLFRTVIMFCDDDIEFGEENSVQEAFDYAIDNNAIILGRVHVKRVETRPELEDSKKLLRDIMQLFLDFKHDGGLGFLAPRGMLLSNALVGGRLRIGQPFADQLYFANLANDRALYFVKASTAISESNYPGNGMFLRDLADYLSEKNNDATAIFTNVLGRYREKNHWGKFCAEDVENFTDLLQTRNKRKLSLAAQELLSRR
jgi:hypothetical protein